MAATTSMVQVSSQQELESAVASYIAQGFVVSNRTPDSVLMFKKKEFSVIWAVVGLVLCALPLLVYLIVYATQSDRMVEIRLGTAGAVAQLGAGGPAGEPVMSDDRHYWWDGAEWRLADQEIPPHARRSDDGHYWWDGVEWRTTAVPGEAAADAPTTLWAPPAPSDHPTTTTAVPAEPSDADLDDLVVVKRKPDDLPRPEPAP